MTAVTRRALLGPTEREIGRQSVMNALARNGITGKRGDPSWPDPLITAWHWGEEPDMGLFSRITWFVDEHQPTPRRLPVAFGRRALSADENGVTYGLTRREKVGLAVLVATSIVSWFAVGYAAHWLWAVVTT